jgi:hypothetical protein
MAQEPSPFAAWGQGSVAAPAPPTPAAPDPPAAAPARHHVQVGATGPRLILCAALAAGLAAAIVLALGGSPAAPLKLLRGATFTAVAPAGYALSLTYPLAGFQKFQLTSGAGGQDLGLTSSSVPPAGTIELTVSDVPLSVASSASHNARLTTLQPLALLPLVVELPNGAQHVVTSQQLHPATLAGQAAAAISYSYTYQGVANVQSDIVTRRGEQLLGVELDSDPGLQGQALAAERALLAHWSWIAPAVS